MPPTRLEWNSGIIDRFGSTEVPDLNRERCVGPDRLRRRDDELLIFASDVGSGSVDGDPGDLETLQVQVERVERLRRNCLDHRDSVDCVRIDIHVESQRVVLDVVTAIAHLGIQGVAGPGRPHARSR